ncbi:MAG: hypothetical protein LBD55_02865 [Treponema sp.]|jgi:hypothetical protein|nr:hypothetical protein [Treponema sp.]
MKKLLAVFVVLAAVCSGAFAEITWGGGGRAVLRPIGNRFYQPDIEDQNACTYFGSENPWSGNGVRLGLSVTGSRPEGNMGFKISFNVEHGVNEGFPGVDDNAANLWIKPFGGIFETFTFTLGIFQVDNLRYKFAGAGSSFHNYIWYARGDMTDEDATFARFHSKGFGSHFAWAPIEGLWIGWQLGSVGDTRSFAGEFKEDGWINALIASQFGAGYTIKDIGLIRAQFLGPITKKWVKTGDETFGWENTALDVPPNKTGDAVKVQAAFNLTAVKGFNLDFGVSVPFAYERDYWSDLEKNHLVKTVKTQEEIVASLGFDLTMFAPFRLWGLTSLKLGAYNETTPAGGGSATVNKGTVWAIHLTPMYTVAPNNIVGLDLFLDVRSGSDEGPAPQDKDPTVLPDPDAKNNYADFGFGVFYRRNIAGGDIRVALTMKLPGGEAHKGAQPQLFLPVMFNYNF